MITDLILGAIFAGISALLALVPDMTLPDPDVTGNPLTIVRNLGRVVPVDDFVIAIGVCLAAVLALQLWDGVVWVYHQFWGSE